jgi:hypothetical protein
VIGFWENPVNPVDPVKKTGVSGVRFRGSGKSINDLKLNLNLDRIYMIYRIRVLLKSLKSC